MFLIDGVRVDIRIIVQFLCTCMYVHYWDSFIIYWNFDLYSACFLCSHDQLEMVLCDWICLVQV